MNYLGIRFSVGRTLYVIRTASPGLRAREALVAVATVKKFRPSRVNDTSETVPPVTTAVISKSLVFV
jgi:hypothetical protein